MPNDWPVKNEKLIIEIWQWAQGKYGDEVAQELATVLLLKEPDEPWRFARAAIRAIKLEIEFPERATVGGKQTRVVREIPWGLMLEEEGEREELDE